MGTLFEPALLLLTAAPILFAPAFSLKFEFLPFNTFNVLADFLARATPAVAGRLGTPGTLVDD